jgi:SAM-dependent methyltransferase
MGILTEAGKVISSMYDKYKQINRFLEIVDDEIEKWDQPRIHVIDFGCGKSYLTFVLYHYLTAVRHLDVRMVGLDLKKEVIDHCNRTAQKYGYGGLSFELGDISGYQSTFPVDMVITLHACDTATDHALYHALRWNAKLIFSVPCCQHELNRQIKSDRLSALTRYGLIKERAAALFTDAIRANLLVYGGYEAQLLEFIELEHTPKNILIRARKAALPQKARTQAMDEVKRMMEEFSLQPTLYRLMMEDR